MLTRIKVVLTPTIPLVLRVFLIMLGYISWHPSRNLMDIRDVAEHMPRQKAVRFGI